MLSLQNVGTVPATKCHAMAIIIDFRSYILLVFGFSVNKKLKVQYFINFKHEVPI